MATALLVGALSTDRTWSRCGPGARWQPKTAARRPRPNNHFEAAFVTARSLLSAFRRTRDLSLRPVPTRVRPGPWSGEARVVAARRGLGDVASMEPSGDASLPLARQMAKL